MEKTIVLAQSASDGLRSFAKRSAASVVLLALFFACSLSPAQTKPIDSVPWEPDDLPRRGAKLPTAPNPARVFQDAALSLIGVYQNRIGPLSIHRCPYTPSCSNFARRAIERHGLFVGLCMFIDRNMYRENPGMFRHYNLRRLPGGVLKLDDQFFLGEVHR
ncbi:MAG: membrane protein insertion efficiency factor YidD [Ignavibacteria bacterium]|nr:membrane protein insertion efficiency factor YidD [Ignavibacteria bacterium]